MIYLKKYLKKIDACSKSLKWAGNRKTSKAAWLACPRADWLLWLAGRIGIDKNLIILAACDIAESVLHLVPENEERPGKAIETVRAFVAGKATIEEVRAARAAAIAVYNTYAARAAARAAANAAANAIFSTYAGGATIARAISVADAAADAAYAAYAATNRDNVWAEKQKELADIVRKRIPWNVWKEKL